MKGFCLRPGTLSPAASALLLRGGDTLIAVAGTPVSDGSADPPSVFAKCGHQGTPIALTFLRHGAEFTVLSHSAALGKWDNVQPSAPDPETPSDAVTETSDYSAEAPALVNWEVFRSIRHSGDLHPVRPPPLAAVLPAVWLMQMHIWPALTAVLLLHMFSFAVGYPLFAATYVLMSIYVWRASLSLLRNDRISRGLLPWMVVAARNETEAQAICRRFDPHLRFAYEGAGRHGERP